MAKTIIQTIGPLYGEVVNGTVFGRPNGSIYVPPTNTIQIQVEDANKYVRIFGYGGTWVRSILCNSVGQGRGYNVIAESQDTQAHIETYLTDSDGEIIGTPAVLTAGIFNIQSRNTINNCEETDVLTANATYRLYAVLCSASGVPVATTYVELTGVVIE